MTFVVLDAVRTIHDREVTMSRMQMQRRSLTPPFMSSLAREVDHLQDSINRMFESPFSAPFPAVESLGWLPAAEITESDTELKMTVELPGMERKDVHIDLDGDVLTVRGEKRSERVEGSDTQEYYLQERSYGVFQRSFTLPPTVDTEKIGATFEKGVLAITMPKTTAPAKRGREIAIDGK